MNKASPKKKMGGLPRLSIFSFDTKLSAVVTDWLRRCQSHAIICWSLDQCRARGDSMASCIARKCVKLDTIIARVSHDTHSFVPSTCQHNTRSSGRNRLSLMTASCLRRHLLHTHALDGSKACVSSKRIMATMCDLIVTAE